MLSLAFARYWKHFFYCNELNLFQLIFFLFFFFTSLLRSLVFYELEVFLVHYGFDACLPIDLVLLIPWTWNKTITWSFSFFLKRDTIRRSSRCSIKYHEIHLTIMHDLNWFFFCFILEFIRILVLLDIF